MRGVPFALFRRGMCIGVTPPGAGQYAAQPGVAAGDADEHDVEILDIDTVYLDAPAVRIVEPLHQLDAGGFPAA